MSMPPSPSPPANRLLARLPGTEYERLLPRLQTVALKFKQVLYEARSRIDYTYFPIRGIVSVIIRMKNGSAIEVATVGCEGVVGLPAFPGPETSSYQVIVQVAGDALRIKAEELEVAAEAEDPLRRLLRRYLRAFLAQVSEMVACNGLHTVQHRCCRWLLETQDRVQANVFPLTHEFLAIMLGVQRASVSEVLDPLQKQGWIGSRRGKLTINDRGRLEAACCECYRAVNAEFDRLLAWPSPSRPRPKQRAADVCPACRGPFRSRCAGPRDHPRTSSTSLPRVWPDMICRHVSGGWRAWRSGLSWWAKFVPMWSGRATSASCA